MVSLHGLDALVVVAVEEHVAREEGEHRPDLAPARRPALVSHAASDADRGTDRLGTAKVSTNSWGSGRGRLRRAPCPGGLQALPDAGSARTLPRWAAGENYGVRRLDRYILSMCEPTAHRFVWRAILPPPHRFLERQREPTLPASELSVPPA